MNSVVQSCKLGNITLHDSVVFMCLGKLFLTGVVGEDVRNASGECLKGDECIQVSGVSEHGDAGHVITVPKEKLDEGSEWS